jgi:hypothetical protein
MSCLPDVRRTPIQTPSSTNLGPSEASCFVEEINFLPLPGLKSRIVQIAAYLLHWPCYPGFLYYDTSLLLFKLSTQLQIVRFESTVFGGRICHIIP